MDIDFYRILDVDKLVVGNLLLVVDPVDDSYLAVGLVVADNPPVGNLVDVVVVDRMVVDILIVDSSMMAIVGMIGQGSLLGDFDN